MTVPDFEPVKTWEENAGRGQSPLLSWGGVDARSRKCSEATAIRADGVVLIKLNQLLLTNTTPSAPTM